MTAAHIFEAATCGVLVLVGVFIAAVKANKQINRITGGDK